MAIGPRDSAAAGLLALGLLVACFAGSVQAQNGDLCANTIDDNWLNKCRLQSPPGFWTEFAGLVQQWVNPRTQAIVAVAAVLGLPLTLRGELMSASLVARFNACKVSLLNFVHRMSYALVLDVALYAVFRQHRPCKCPSDPDGGGYIQIGSIYGMPSGDAMAGALLAAYLLDRGPLFRIGSRLAGVLLIVAVCIERMALGYHSLAQVTVGSLLGVLLHFYQTRAPQGMILVDAFVQIVLGCITLNVDPALVYSDNDQNNLFSWFVWGIGFELFAVALIVRHYSKRGQLGSLFRFSPARVADFDPNSHAYAVLDAAEEREVTLKPAPRSAAANSLVLSVADALPTWLAFVVLNVILFISQYWALDNWAGRSAAAASASA